MKTIKFLLVISTLTLIQLPISAGAQIYTWSTLAGLSGAGNSGTNDGVGNNARFFEPTGIGSDGAGNVYVADFGNLKVRKLMSGGAVSNWTVTTAINPKFIKPYSIVADFSGNNFYLADTEAATEIWQFTASGSLWTSNGISTLNGAGISVDSSGNVQITSKNEVFELTPVIGNWNQVVIAGSSSPGSSDGNSTQARFNSPAGVCCIARTNIYVSDTGNHTIRKLTQAGTNWNVTTIAGQVGIPGLIDGTNTSALFFSPNGMIADQVGNLYVADEGNNVIRKLTPSGTNWVVTTIGGLLSGASGSQDGVGITSSFYHPSAVAVDTSGKVYVADYGNNTIRMGTPSTNAIPPALQISTAGGVGFVMWPFSAAGFQLQSTTNLATGPWMPVTSGITTNLVYSNAMTGQAFFRLLTQ